jgi:hypothetical protein
MKGPFEMKAKASKEIEPRYTSSKNTSLAYTLLHEKYESRRFLEVPSSILAIPNRRL